MAIELKGVAKRVGGDTHIHPTDLRLHPGTFNVLIGTTLAGKTTLLRLMAGLERPTAGEVWFEGRNVTGVAVQKRRVAMVYQQFINYPNMSVFDNIASPLRIMKLPAAQIDQRVGRVASLLKLEPMLARMPDELSGGQQQRVALARALVKQAGLVLLDEPLANLDYKLREELREELPKLFQDSGATVVYATTEPSEALLLGGYTATLHEGRVIQYGRTAGVYRAPNTLLSARIFSDPPINTTRVEKAAGRFRLAGGAEWPAGEALAGLPDGDYTLAFRPHHINLSPTGRHAVRVEGRVVITEISGSESVVHAHVGDDTWISLSHGVHRFNIGDPVTLYLQCDRCLLFDQRQQLIPADGKEPD